MYCGTVNVFAAECLYRVNINKRSLKVIDVGGRDVQAAAGGGGGGTEALCPEVWRWNGDSVYACLYMTDPIEIQILLLPYVVGVVTLAVLLLSSWLLVMVVVAVMVVLELNLVWLFSSTCTFVAALNSMQCR